MEAIYEYLSLHLGAKKAPLSYVVRAEVDPPTTASDPAYGQPDSKYISPQDEIIARSPIKVPGIALVYHPDFLVDNKTVWEIISGLCRDEDC